MMKSTNILKKLSISILMSSVLVTINLAGGLYVLQLVRNSPLGITIVSFLLGSLLYYAIVENAGMRGELEALREAQEDVYACMDAKTATRVFERMVERRRGMI